MRPTPTTPSRSHGCPATCLRWWSLGLQPQTPLVPEGVTVVDLVARGRTAYLEVPDPGDAQPLAVPPGMTVRWLARG